MSQSLYFIAKVASDVLLVVGLLFFPLFSCRPKKIALKAHLHPNGIANVCYCFQTVLLFFLGSDWLPELSCERENRRVCSKQIGAAIAHRFALGSCPNLRPQFTNL